jgi:glycine/D-amino acid oxidase-like deaminating enzyme
MLIDFLIVGQGLAGSLLAFELIQRGCKVMVIDNNHENASQVAAGLINPITGIRLVKAQDIDILLTSAHQRYAELTMLFQQPFYVESPMLKIFLNADEYRYGQKRWHTPEYHAYLGKNISDQKTKDTLETPFGYLEQKQTGYLLTRPLLQCLKDYFITHNSYYCADFAYTDLRLTPHLQWQHLKPSKVIFCEGYQAIHNPWFSWLPFQPVKGDILTLQHSTPLPEHILNYGHWLIPLNNHTLRVGATFDRDISNVHPSLTGKNSLLHQLNTVSKPLSTATLISHQAQIRPCTLDKSPYIGQHPQHTQLAIFNGFGAKGSLQIPLYSTLFADNLLHNAPPPCSIARHYATHFLPT